MPIGFKTVFYKEFAGYFRSGNAYIILGVYALLSFAATFYVGGYFTLRQYVACVFFSLSAGNPDGADTGRYHALLDGRTPAGNR